MTRAGVLTVLNPMLVKIGQQLLTPTATQSGILNKGIIEVCNFLNLKNTTDIEIVIPTTDAEVLCVPDASIGYLIDRCQSISYGMLGHPTPADLDYNIQKYESQFVGV
jgi:hypothetical protein